MASSKNSKTEKTKKGGESTETANKPGKSRKDEDLEKHKKKKKNPKDKEKVKDLKKTNKKDNDNNKDKEQKNKKNKLSNGYVKENKMPIVQSSSAEEGESTYEEDNTEITNGRTTEAKPNKGKRKKGDDDSKVAEDSKTQKFPMHRIKTIIRAEEIDSRVSQEAVFVINKAAEKFLEQLTQNAYNWCMQDRKKSLSYKHLSSVVSKQRRYDFLSDFVPEKIKAEDALAERNAAGTGELKNCKT